MNSKDLIKIKGEKQKTIENGKKLKSLNNII